jgi:hypothetical protein
VENGLASDAPLDESVLSNIKNFANLNKLKKEAFRYIAGSLAPTQVMELQSTFKVKHLSCLSKGKMLLRSPIGIS